MGVIGVLDPWVRIPPLPPICYQTQTRRCHFLGVKLVTVVTLNAFREVEDSLLDLAALAAQGEAVHRALASARETATLANERYPKGLTSYLDVADAQRDSAPSQTSGQAIARPAGDLSYSARQG
jgi:hypothetical protein